MNIRAVIFDMYETLITQYRSKTYFSGDIAKDMGIDEASFRRYWSISEEARTLGKAELKEVVGDIMQRFDCFSRERLDVIYKSRLESKKSQFFTMDKEIIPMLEELKRNNIKIGLVSNCYLEEAEAIKESQLFSYFDVPMLSCEVGIMKPDQRIFRLSAEKLGIMEKECLYVGDGGSNELYGAGKTEMNVLQACWYIKEWQKDYRQERFEKADSPLDIIRYIKLHKEM